MTNQRRDGSGVVELRSQSWMILTRLKTIKEQKITLEMIQIFVNWIINKLISCIKHLVIRSENDEMILVVNMHQSCLIYSD